MMCCLPPVKQIPYSWTSPSDSIHAVSHHDSLRGPGLGSCPVSPKALVNTFSATAAILSNIISIQLPPSTNNSIYHCSRIRYDTRIDSTSISQGTGSSDWIWHTLPCAQPPCPHPAVSTGIPRPVVSYSRQLSNNAVMIFLPILYCAIFSDDPVPVSLEGSEAYLGFPSRMKKQGPS